MLYTWKSKIYTLVFFAFWIQILGSLYSYMSSRSATYHLLGLNANDLSTDHANATDALPPNPIANQRSFAFVLVKTTNPFAFQPNNPNTENKTPKKLNSQNISRRGKKRRKRRRRQRWRRKRKRKRKRKGQSPQSQNFSLNHRSCGIAEWQPVHQPSRSCAAVAVISN